MSACPTQRDLNAVRAGDWRLRSVSDCKSCEDERKTTNSEEEKAKRCVQRRPRQSKLGAVKSRNCFFLTKQSFHKTKQKQEATYSKEDTASHFTTTWWTYFSDLRNFTTGNCARFSATTTRMASRPTHEAVSNESKAVQLQHPDRSPGKMRMQPLRAGGG